MYTEGDIDSDTNPHRECGDHSYTHRGLIYTEGDIDRDTNPHRQRGDHSYTHRGLINIHRVVKIEG